MSERDRKRKAREKKGRKTKQRERRRGTAERLLTVRDFGVVERQRSEVLATTLAARAALSIPPLDGVERRRRQGALPRTEEPNCSTASITFLLQTPIVFLALFLSFFLCFLFSCLSFHHPPRHGLCYDAPCGVWRGDGAICSHGQPTRTRRVGRLFHFFPLLTLFFFSFLPFSCHPSCSSFPSFLVVIV